MEKNEKDNDNKLNFLSKFIISIKDFEKYIFLAAEKSSRAISYFIKLILLFSLTISLVFIFKFANIVNGIATYIDENIEELNYKSGILEIATIEPLEIDNENGTFQKLIIDTKKDANIGEHISKINLYNNGILILRDKLIVKNSTNNRQTEIKYNSFNITDFNKNELLSLIKSNEIYIYYTVVIISTFIFLFIYFIYEFFIDAISLALLGYLVGRINRMRIKLSATYNIGTYALTLPIVLKLIYIITNLITGIEIKYFNWMYTAISYVYVVVAILMIKADFIDKQMQMMKIYEERKNNKEENTIVEDDKNDDNKEKKDKDNDNKKENKDKDNNIGESQDPAMQE